MHHKAADLRLLLFWPLIGVPIAVLVNFLAIEVSNRFTAKTYFVAEDGSRVEFFVQVAGEVTGSVMPEGAQVPLLGRFELGEGRLTFRPVVPMESGRTYQADWKDSKGAAGRMMFFLKPPPVITPTVEILPQAVFPANALKFYLHFSEPMEQGVFLERLRLLDADGNEVIGPFRETELWSPDGKRLTVWFHPGRQKTGVNLNEEEGPVLSENMKHALVVAGSWRSTSGVALGEDVRFDFQVGPADHTMPKIEKWQITAPRSGTREPLLVRFDESLDPAMLASALSVHRGSESVPLQIEVDGLNWRAIPAQPWVTGSYELRADPNLEDLAGNNLKKLFEVDLAEAPAMQSIITARSFEIR